MWQGCRSSLGFVSKWGDTSDFLKARVEEGQLVSFLVKPFVGFQLGGPDMGIRTVSKARGSQIVPCALG